MIERLLQMGILIPIAFSLFFAIYYKLLQRTKLAESKALNATLAACLSLLTSTAFLLHFTLFFFLTFLATLALLLGVLLFSFFHPTLKEWLVERLKSPLVLYGLVAGMLGLFGLTLALLGLPRTVLPGKPPLPALPPELFLPIAVLTALMLCLLVISYSIKKSD